MPRVPHSLLSGLIPLVLAAFFLSLAPRISAQNPEYKEWLDQSADDLLQTARDAKKKENVGSERSARMREQLEAEQRATTREKTYSFPEPVLSPDGRQLAAIVNDEYMTLDDLNSRVRAVLKEAKPIRNPDRDLERTLNEDRVLKVANQILDDWVMNKMLSIQGAKLGYGATESEIDESLNTLTKAQAELAGSEGGSPTQMIGIPAAELRTEIRDSLIIEKYINAVVDQSFTDKDFERIYNASPASFQLPDRVRAFHVFQPILGRATPDDLNDMSKFMNKVRKQLRKADDDDRLAAIVRQADGQTWSAGDMGWVTSDNLTLDPQLLIAMFSLKVGDTSEVLQVRDGFHIFRILERESGSGGGYQRALPQLRNYLFTKTKYATYEAFKPAYTIITNTGGIKRWKEVKASELERSTAQLTRPDPSKGVSLKQLREELEAEKQANLKALEKVTGSLTSPAIAPATAPTATATPTPAAPAIDLSILNR